MNGEDHDILTRLVTLVEVQGQDIAEIKADLKARPCPSGLCAAHSTDIAKLKYRNSLMAWSFGSILTIMGLIIALVSVAG